jgi:hypothetical protein
MIRLHYRSRQPNELLCAGIPQLELQDQVSQERVRQTDGETPTFSRQTRPLGLSSDPASQRSGLSPIAAPGQG